MNQVKAIVKSVDEIQNDIYLLKVSAPEISLTAKPGQFCNIKVSDSEFPLLRRPFSICEVDGDNISFMFNLVGLGTDILSKKKDGEVINVIGPLGNGFDLKGKFKNALIVAGGIGSAPFPFVIQAMGDDKEIACFAGGRSEEDIITYGMKNALTSTDDGSAGYQGNVVQLLESKIVEYDIAESKIFACGPTPMLRAVSEFSIRNNIECEISTESVMACGIGICQGCPIESRKDDSFVLVCKDGPVFKAEDVKI
ncbi:MAG: dihydroorotate dehydrogenase electron transfer subunit [Bacteroidota bacterium]